ncbi:hypothetical protein IFM89_017251 [Coptis chinensis]|uniref:Uncharacterized protein n=1 Tax=Coptis chinensis TaxID=261450 RepID=A0A835HFU6_9MAGN|nr:hypothetical protein IFM89_017251 [Coptis chinensis]
MTMDRTASLVESSSSSPSPKVLTIECLKGSSKADEWNGNMLQTGDIVEQLKIGVGGNHNNCLSLQAPFKNGKNGVQKILHDSFKKKQTSILVRVRRGNHEFVELQACIVPNELSGSGRSNKYILRSISDPNYAVGFIDRTENECFALQGEEVDKSETSGSRSSRVVCALSNAQLQDGYVSYPWEKKMKEFLPVPHSSCFPSLLLLPKASDLVASRYNDLEDTLARANAWLLASQGSGVPIVFMNVQTESLLTKLSSRYNDLEDTLARANAWLHASQGSGVPIVFMNVQTESLLTKISGETASSTVNAGSLSDLSNLANVSLYGFEDYHGVDIGVVRAVRLWYTPIGGEMAVEIKLQEGDTKLGFAISRTEEGFIYISSVIDVDEHDGVAAVRSGLTDLYKEATKASKLLVVSRVSNEKVLPWMVSSTGAVRCFDTVSLSQKLSLHRHALRPILIHLYIWDRRPVSQTEVSARVRSVAPSVMPVPTEVQLPQLFTENQVPGEAPGPTLVRDTAGEMSFRFHDFSLSNNWV